MSLPAPRTHMQWTWKESRPYGTAKGAAQQHIFQKRYVRESADLIKQGVTDEDPLIAVRESAPADTLSIPPFPEPIRPSSGVNLLLEGTKELTYRYL